MKIILVVARKAVDDPFGEVKYSEANSMKEANTIEKNSIDKKTYSLLRALENNNAFISQVNKLRKVMGIPIEGYQWKNWRTNVKKSLTDEDYSHWRNKLRRLSKQELADNFAIPTLLHGNLQYIVIANCIYVPIPKMAIIYEGSLMPVYDGPEVSIFIQAPVTIKQIHDFIDENAAELEKAMKTLGDTKEIFISERDRKIIELYEVQNLPYKKIANLLEEDSPNGHLTDDAVKTAYHTAKAKIRKLSK